MGTRRVNGFTLLEILITLAIIGLMVSLVAGPMSDFFSVHLRSSTRKLSSTIRYLRDKSATENLYIRLIFDFEKMSYWVEATADPFLLTTKEMEELEKKEVEEEKKAEKKEEVGEMPLASSVKKYRTPEFTAVDEFLLKPVKFPEDVILKDVSTTRDREPVAKGQAFIHFFPNGSIEPAIINLTDEEGKENYSIEINPITGTTNIVNEYRLLKEARK